MDARTFADNLIPVGTDSRAQLTQIASFPVEELRPDLTLVKPSCIETLRALFWKLGYAERVSELMTLALRPSWINLYENHWQWFVLYMSVQEHDDKLFDDNNSTSTVISHRTSIASVLRHWKYDPAMDRNVRMLLRVIQLEKPVQRKTMPQWNLHLVLMALHGPPFASTGDNPSNKVLYLKIWFLLSLATAHRWLFLSVALAHCCQLRRRGWATVSLLPEPGFLAKNQLPSQVLSWVKIPGIDHLNSSPRWMWETALCQVFVSLPPMEPVGQRHLPVSSLVEVVKTAYLASEKVIGHELRTLALSWAYSCHIVLEDVLLAAFWHSSGVLRKDYLRHLSLVWWRR